MGLLRTIVACMLVICSVGCNAQQMEAADAVDYARLDSGTTVHAVSEGVNPPPYDVHAALGEGECLSYPGAVPNWFELDLGQERTIRAVEIDRRYTAGGPDDFDVSFALEPGQWTHTIEVRGVGASEEQHWFTILEQPVQARYVRMEVFSLHEIQWTTINRFSLYGTSRIPRLVEENSERYEWLSERLEGISRQAAQLATAPDGLADASAEATQMAQLLAGTEEIEQDRWLEIQERFQPLQDAAYEAQAQLSFASIRAADIPVAVGAVGAMTHVFRHIWPEEAADTLRLSCARNERESGQVLVAAVQGDLTDVTVTFDPLTGPAMLEDAVEPGLICYVNTKSAPILTHHIGLWPDGISPVAPFDLPQGQVQPIWLTVAIPKDAPAGEYSTTAHIAADGMPQLSVPVAVTVWDFTLPDKISLPNVFSVSSQLVDAWYRGQKLTWDDDLKGEYYRFWLEHRLNPTSLYGTMQPPVEDLDVTLAGGMNAFVMKYLHVGDRDEDEFMQQALEDLARWDEVLAERDLYDSAIVYLADEPAQKQSVTDAINRRAQIVGQRFPQMRRMLVLTRPIDRDFDGSVDIWCPIVGEVTAEDAADAHARGEECWWYTVGHFFDLDMPTASARTMPWLTFKHDFDGILYWVIQSSWRGANRPSNFSPVPGETIWADFDPSGHGSHNGIGNMIYPGDDGRPWSSQRLEILREGMEDYEYLLLLREAIERNPASPHAALLDIPEQFSETYPVGTDAGFITDWRDAIGRALHELK